MLRRLQSEQGYALPLALAIVLVLSIAIYAVLEYSSANTRTSSLNERRQSAKALAEAGVAHGASFLAQQGSSYTTNVSPQTAVIQGHNVTWSATYAAPIWTVSATASEPNPTGPGSNVGRTVQAQFEWTPTGSGPWHGLYVGNPGTVPLMSNAEASIATDVYVNGNITLTQGKFLGNSFQVWGSLTLDSSGMFDTSVGASDRVNCGGADYRSFKSSFPAPCIRPTHRVATFKTRDGCRFDTSATPAHTSCSTTSRMGGPSGKIWLTCPSCTDPAPHPSSTPGNSTNYTSTAYNPMVAADYFVLTAPDVPPLSWDIGPGKPCVTPAGAPDFTSGEPDIMGSSSYTCKSADGAGELSWNASTNKLTVKGKIYFNTKVTLQSGRHGEVVGTGSIYVQDKLTLKNHTGLCGLKAATSPRCDPAWDPLTAGNIVNFMVGSDDNEAILQDNFHFQGGLYTDHGGYFVQNDSSFKGPTTFEGPVRIQNNGTIDAWAPSSPPSSSGGPLQLTLVRGSWRS